jgi:hypothetical protein
MTNLKSFSQAKSSVVIRPKSVNTQGFIYRDFTDLKNLVKFVGGRPSIDENGELWFGKHNIKDNSLIIRTGTGKVYEVLTMEEAETQFEIVADSTFLPEHANVTVAKAPKVKGDKGMTRNELKDALTKMKVEFKSGLTRDELQKVYDEKMSKK